MQYTSGGELTWQFTNGDSFYNLMALGIVNIIKAYEILKSYGHDIQAVLSLQSKVLVVLNCLDESTGMLKGNVVDKLRFLNNLLLSKDSTTINLTTPTCNQSDISNQLDPHMEK